MERKLVKQGRDALTVTLPAKWLKQKGLKPGDSVFIEQHDKFLKLNTSAKVRFTETAIDAREMIGTMSWHAIIARYIEGYDKIEILHDSPGRIQEFCTKLIGMIIEEHTSTRTVLRSIISEPEQNIDVLIRRVLNMFMQLANTLQEVSEKKSDVLDLKTQEELLDNTVYYCMRYLNKYSVEDKAYRYFLLCYVVEEAGDILKNMSKFQPSKKIVGLVQSNVCKYVSNMSKGNFAKAYNELRSFRNAVEGKDFMNGLAFLLAETLYNNLGYMIHRN